MKPGTFISACCAISILYAVPVLAQDSPKPRSVEVPFALQAAPNFEQAIKDSGQIRVQKGKAALVAVSDANDGSTFIRVIKKAKATEFVEFGLPPGFSYPQSHLLSWAWSKDIRLDPKLHRLRVSEDASIFLINAQGKILFRFVPMSKLWDFRPGKTHPLP
ncbi:MAG TPA: hypothetical protein DEB40_08365 [Elusimicrobia bacterium]|nr:hypothetical protein [Elusimicrobiota bacterium]HBT61742.1 hypothetical protein [Elusimicrobiota bacterium]